MMKCVLLRWTPSPTPLFPVSCRPCLCTISMHLGKNLCAKKRWICFAHLGVINVWIGALMKRRCQVITSKEVLSISWSEQIINIFKSNILKTNQLFKSVVFKFSKLTQPTEQVSSSYYLQAFLKLFILEEYFFT